MVRTQLGMLFDRGFANFDKQWTDELFEVQLQHLTTLLDSDDDDSSEEEEQNEVDGNSGPKLVPSAHSSRASSVISDTNSRKSRQFQTAPTLHSGTESKNTSMPMSTAVMPKNSPVTTMNNKTSSAAATMPQEEDSFQKVRRRHRK